MAAAQPTVGLIGAGLMGHGIARNVARKGFALQVLDHPGNQPLDTLRGLGVGTAPTPKALAANVDVLILCVTGTPQVEDALLGSAGEGALQALKPGAVVIDCSTAIPQSTAQIAKAVTDKGCLFLDAPMTRTPKEAAEGRLNLLVGGDAAVLEQCRPILQTFAENITHTGATGSGHRMKLLHNYVSLGTVALIAEAAACALRGDVAPEVFVDVLAKGGGGGVALERLRPYIIEQDPSALKFFMSNALKDMNYYVAMTREGGSVQDIADSVHDIYASAVAEAGPQALVPELVGLLKRGVVKGA